MTRPPQRTAGLCVPLLCVAMLLAPPPAAAADVAAAEPFTLIEADVRAVSEAFAEGILDPGGLIEVYLARIEAFDRGGPELHTLITFDAGAPERTAAGEHAGTAAGALAGIPIVIKDNIDVVGFPTTGGSAALRGHEPFYDAAVLARIRAAGGIPIAKANLSEMELPYGRFGYSSAGGQSRNPYRPQRDPFSSAVPAAVAANLAMLGVGTDTLGELRGAASASGVVGIRPTLGLVSRAGIVPTALSLDTPGPVARTVRDAALLLGVMAGPDESDPRTLESAAHRQEDYVRFLDDTALDGARIGIPDGLYGGHHDVDAAFRDAERTLEARGAEVVRISLPEDLAGDLAARLDRIVETEPRDQLGAYLLNTEEGMPHSLADLVRMSESPLIAGSATPVHPARLAAYRRMLHSLGLADLTYLEEISRALPALRARIVALLDDEGLDALALPTLLCPAGSLLDAYDSTYDCAVDDPQRPAYLASAAGLPEITLPMGFTGYGLPIGLSLLGPPWSEPRLIALAYDFEQATRVRRPPESAPALPDMPAAGGAELAEETAREGE